MLSERTMIISPPSHATVPRSPPSVNTSCTLLHPWSSFPVFYQAYYHNPKSKKTARILSINHSGLCKRCNEVIEWKKQYRKYKPLKVSLSAWEGEAICSSRLPLACSGSFRLLPLPPSLPPHHNLIISTTLPLSPLHMFYTWWSMY